MYLPVGLLADLGQGFEEVLAIHIVPENVLAPIASAHDACPAVAHGEGGWYLAPGYWMRNGRGIRGGLASGRGLSEPFIRRAPPLTGTHIRWPKAESVNLRN